MTSKKHPKEANKPVPSNTKPTSSTKTTHGSLTSASAGSNHGSGGNYGGNRDANSGNGQRETWALQKWLEQAPRDEPWRPGSRKA